MNWSRSWLQKWPKYLSKLILFTLLISTIPIISLGIFYYLTSSAGMLKHTTHNQQQLLEQTQITVEKNIQMMESALTQLAVLPSTTAVINTPLHESEFIQLREIDRFIGYTTIREVGIYQLYFINLKKQWAIFPDKVFALDDSFAESYHRLKKDFGKYPYLFAHREGLDSPISELGIPYGLIMVRPSPMLESPDILIISRMPFDQLDEWIAGSKTSGSTFILTSDMQVIASNTEAASLSDLEPMLVQDQYEFSHSNDYFEASLAGEPTYLFYQKSSFTDWIYVSAVPKSLIAAEGKRIGWITLLTSLGLFALMLITAYSVSLYMYSPIRRLFGSLRSEEGHDKDKHPNEIDFIGESISRMKKQIYSQNKELHKFYIIKLLHGELSHNELEQVMEQHPQIDERTRFAVFIIDIDELDQSRFGEDDRDLLLFASMNIVEESVPAISRLSPVVLNHAIVCVLVLDGDEASAKRSILQWSKACQQNLGQYLKLTVSIGISRTFDKLIWANEAYEDGIDALKYRVRFGNASILFIEDVYPMSRRSSFRYPVILSNLLLDAIKLCDIEKIEEYLHQFISTLYDSEGSMAEYQMSLIRLLSEIMRLHPIESDEALKIDGQLMPTELLQLQTSHEIREWFMNHAIKPVVRRIQEENQKQYKRISDEVIALVESDEDFSMTLESLGAKLNYSPAYLSQVFRKEKGMSFTEYMTEHRIHASKKWLVETDLSINELSAKLNYTNPQNFIRSFKRETGLTPGQYRDKHTR